MNILHITTFLQGGAGRIIQELALDQQKKGNNVVIVTSKTSEPGYCNYEEYIEKLESNNIPIYKIDSTFKRDLYLNLRVVKEIREIIKQKKIDIIHAHAAIPALVGIVARTVVDRYIPVIQTMHGWGTNKTKEQEFMDTTIMNGLDKVVTVSKTSKELLVDKGVNKELIEVIYNGIKEKSLEEEKDKELKELKEYRKNGYKIIGCIGSICEPKNQKLLVEAFKEVSNQIKSICIFIGEGDLITDLQNLSEKYNIKNKIKFYGYKQNAEQYIKYFDCLVLPSLSEGLPITILEGFREKTPVIGSDILEIKEIINHNNNGFLFRSNSVTSLSNMLISVLQKSDEDIKIITQTAYKDYTNKFRIDLMLEKYLELYKQILE